MSRTVSILVLVVLAAAAAAAASASAAFDPSVEAQNYSKTNERQTIVDTPQYQQKLDEVSRANFLEMVKIQANDPERNFTGHACATDGRGCAGDVRLYDWGPKGYGLVTPVLFTARDGATLSGHVWATRAGPPQRPGIVITNGSIQASEQMYWQFAQTLAKDGYVVLTFDPQGEARSDEYGEDPDRNEGSPDQTDGRPFFDGTEDAINFFLSSPSHPYVPETSCSTGTSHAPKQDRRVKAGLDAGYNPYWTMLDPSRLGIAGHSYGAAGVSYIGQWDPRVKAIVAWDNLSVPRPGTNNGSFPPGEAGCPAHPGDRTDAKIAKPALGITADYFIPPEPNTREPDPYGCENQRTSTNGNNTGCKVKESLEYSKAGVDTGALVIRGGSHYEFSFLPDAAFGATLRGVDLAAWYTSAWFDKYVKGDCTADRRLLTNRWRHDGQEAAIDPNGDGNAFSFYYPSRLDIHLANGRRYDNEHLRSDAHGLTSSDGYAGDYGYAPIDRSPDDATTSFGSCDRAPAATSPHTRCSAVTKLRFRLHHARRTRIVKAQVFVDGKRRLTRRGRNLRSVTVRHLPRRAFRLRIVSTQSNGRKRTLRRAYRACPK